MDLTRGIQSALNPQSLHAEPIATFSWIMFAGAGVVTIIVMVLTALALWSPAARAWMSNQRFIVIGGVVFPAVVLTAMLLYSFSIASSDPRRDAPADLTVEVVGHQWWWRVRYRTPDGALDFETANEIRIPAGRSVEFVLTTEDVIHSFWVPNLGGKLDMIPGHVNHLRVTAARPGVFRGQCAEYCGGPHAQMAFYVIAHEPADFERWLMAQREPTPTAGDSTLVRGRELFMAHCAVCHAVRGTPAKGRLGPNLTHFASRTSLAAGILPNNRGNVAGWISASQHIKPENLMPSMNVFTGPELQAVTDYVMSLR